MRSAFLCVLFCFAGVGLSQGQNDDVQSRLRTMPHQEECAAPLPTDFWDDPATKRFQRAEAWAWNERICMGHSADMRNAPGGSGDGEECQPAEIEKKGGAVPAYRELRPEFLELVLSHEPWASAPRHPQVGILCALVRGSIDLDDHEIDPTFAFHQGKIDGEVSLLGTKFGRSLSLQGSTVTGKLDADRLEVGGSLILRDDTFADIDLLGAKIAGNANLNGSTVTGKLDADGLEVGGSLILSDGTFADIDLLGAKIAGGAELNGSTVTGKLDADRLEVGGNLFLRDDTFADIDLLGAKIAGSAELNGSTVTGKLNAEGLKVGDSLFLYDGGRFARTRLLGAKIGRDVHLSGSGFRGEFDLTGADIGGELHLSSGLLDRSPTWQKGASLILRNVKADVLQARADSWNVSGGDGLLPTDLTGFTFNRLGGLDTSGGASMGDESADWLVGWIEAQRDHGDYYDPQPYSQLAQVLEASGATDKAKEIRYAKFQHKRDYDTSMSVCRRFWLMLERYVVGYGVYPFRALYWLIGLVVLGWLSARCSKEPSVRGGMGLWYSLENALPLIETNECFKNVKHGRPWVDHCFRIQKVFGFVLATVLIGALTLLSG